MSAPANRLLEALRRYKQLNINERLELMPQSELVTLKTILESPMEGPSVSEVAKILDVSSPAISRTIKRLREKNYVHCVVDGSDRRITYLYVTEEGERAVRQNIYRLSRFLNRALSRLEPGEIEAYHAIFEKIYHGMEEELQRMENHEKEKRKRDQKEN